MRMIAGSRMLLAALLVSGGLLVTGNSVLAQNADKGGGTHTMTGIVTDSMCGAKHKMADAAKCTAGCVKGGSKYALLVGDQVVTLEGGSAADLEKLAGQKATVTGTMSGKDAMTVTKVEAAKGQS